MCVCVCVCTLTIEENLHYELYEKDQVRQIYWCTWREMRSSSRDSAAVATVAYVSSATSTSQFNSRSRRVTAAPTGSERETMQSAPRGCGQMAGVRIAFPGSFSANRF